MDAESTPARRDSEIPAARPTHDQNVERRAKQAANADFSAFYHRTFNHVWGILGRHGIFRTDERCEVAQEVYLVASQKRSTRRPEVPELAWIGAIAWRLAWDHRQLHRTRKEQPVDDPDNVAEPIAPGASPEEIVLRRQRYLVLVEDMEPERRMVFEMNELDDLGADEIALTLDLPQGTVATRLRLAREDLTAAEARLAAREAWQERRPPAALGALLPFGVGAWHGVGRAFEDAPAGAADRVWRYVSAALARSTALAVGTGAGAVLSGKLIAALLGVMLGGGAVQALHMLAASPSPPVITLSPAPEVATVAVSTTASAAPGRAEPAPVTVASASPPAPRLVPAGIDPEEEVLLNRANAALARGKLDLARSVLDEHARRFPNGGLRRERERRRAQVEAAQGTAPSGADAGRAPNRLLGTED
jgi:RNA polymerase sigma-70 factor (ECF subfamily)